MSNPSKLDGIIARADAYEAHGTPGLNAPKDRKDLLAALRAVEALHVPWDSEEFYNDIDGGSRSTIKHYCGTCVDGIEVPYSWPCPTITAIREALG